MQVSMRLKPMVRKSTDKIEGDTHRRRSKCPISFGLDIFGDKWTLLVLRDLIMWKKTTFQELKNSAEGIATNILSDRLRKLESYGIIQREIDPDDGRRVIYRVTEKGVDLVPALLEIGAWGARHDKDTGMSRKNLHTFANDRDGVIARVKGNIRKE